MQHCTSAVTSYMWLIGKFRRLCCCNLRKCINDGLKILAPGTCHRQRLTGALAQEDSQLSITSQYLYGVGQEQIEAIISAITRERLSTYVNATATEALALYELNSELSTSIFKVIGSFEIVFRNAVAKAIAEQFNTEDWYQCDEFTSALNCNLRRRIQDVRSRLGNRNLRAGHVISELNFHFWVALHERCYEHTFWTRFLRNIWPEGQRRSEVHSDLLRIKELRNRIAHHEPVFSQDRRAHIDLVWQRLEQLSPDTHALLLRRAESELDSLLSTLDSLD